MKALPKIQCHMQDANQSSISEPVLEDKVEIHTDHDDHIIETKENTHKNELEDYRQITIGFIGIGTITKAMINGLCNPKIQELRAKNIYVSPRNKKNASELADKYKEITIAKDNQDVIDHSDWIVIGLLTTKVKKIIKELKFKPTQTIINLAAMNNEEFSSCINASKTILRACPLPPIALNVGATIISPPNASVQKMFDALGSSVAVQTSHETYSLQGLACLQGMQFSIMKSVFDWMVRKQHIEPEVAKKYVIGTFHSIMVDAYDKVKNHNMTFKDLILEQTPGGLNEQNLKALRKLGVNKQIKKVLDTTYNKMTAKL